MDVADKVLTSVSMFARNMIELLKILILAHQEHNDFCNLLVKLIKNNVKDMLAYEKNTKELHTGKKGTGTFSD